MGDYIVKYYEVKNTVVYSPGETYYIQLVLKVNH